MISRWLSRGVAITQPSQLTQPEGTREKVTEVQPSNGNDNTDSASVKSIDTLAQAYDEPDINLHLLPSGDAAIISIVPPTHPHPGVIASGHVPVDIVLVIDVSASMNAAAPPPKAPDNSTGIQEDFGLSVLDLTKHAALTIMETLNEDDRLSIVTYSTRATVLQPLISMTAQAKDSTKREIAGMQPQATTNMWQGIMHGLDQFNDNTVDCGRVPAIMVLTDGMPNFGDPPKGYVAKLRDMAPLPATIHTFGFGYQLDACLLKAVAEVGGGNFSFIPDSGMIGTVFVHAVAHLQSTHATRCVLEIKTPISLKMVTTHGSIINGSILDKDTAYSKGQHNILRLDLGNLQYGQSRDVYLECRSRTNGKWTFDQAAAAEGELDSGFDANRAVLSASLSYSFMRSNVHTVSRNKALIPLHNTREGEGLSPAIAAYHKSRAMVCHFLMSFFKPHAHAGYVLITPNPQRVDLEEHSNRLMKLIDDIPAVHLLNDASSPILPALTEDERSLLSSLLLDLEGQVTVALSEDKFFKKWAMPYFASLSHAHLRQLCNSFKDPGPSRYNDNAFFRDCRDILDRAFDRIEPPVPSRQHQHHSRAPQYTGHGGFQTNTAEGAPSQWPPAYSPLNSSGPPPSYVSSRPAINMSLYNDCNAGCFAAETLVQLAAPSKYDSQQGAARVPISTIRAGIRLSTPLGSREVRYVLRTAVQDAPLCRIRVGSDANDGGVLATPWHPICISTASPSLSAIAPADGGISGSHHALSNTGWTFPAYLTASPDEAEVPAAHKAEGAVALAKSGLVRYTGWVYTIMLEPDSDPSAHAVLLSSPGSADESVLDQQIWGVTLGHGLTGSAIFPPALADDQVGQKGGSEVDSRPHDFFGSYSAIEKALANLLEVEGDSCAATLAVDTGGLVSCSGMQRDPTTGLVTGFVPL